MGVGTVLTIPFLLELEGKGGGSLAGLRLSTIRQPVFDDGPGVLAEFLAGSLHAPGHLFAPSAGTEAKAAFETGVEMPKVVEPTLLSHIYDLDVRVSQQRGDLNEAQLRSELSYRRTKIPVKQPREVPSAAAKPRSQFGYRKIKKLPLGQLVKDLFHVLVGSKKPWTPRSGRFEFFSKDTGDDGKNLGALFKAGLLREMLKKPLALERGGCRSSINPKAPKAFDDILEQTQLTDVEQREQLLQQQRKAQENHPGFLGHNAVPFWSLSQNENVALLNTPTEGCIEIVTAPPRNKQEEKTVISRLPCVSRTQTQRSHSKVILIKHLRNVSRRTALSRGFHSISLGLNRQ